MTVTRRGAIITVCLGLMALRLVYWAFVPLYRVEIQSPEPLTLGSAVTTHIISAGGIRRQPSAELTLIQGKTAAPIGFNVGFGHPFASWFYPFSSKTSFTLTIGADVIRKFEDGPAVLEVTIKGRSRWYALD